MQVANKRESVTIYDVAKEAGTSKSTAARVMAKTGSVSERVSSAVMEAANRLGYQPDEQARRLATGRFDNVVDIFTADLDYGVILRRIKSIQVLLQSRDLEVSYHICSLQSKSKAQTIQKLRRRKPRAIVASTWSMDEDAVNELNGYMQDGGVVVCFGTNEALPLQCDQILFDEEQNTYLAVRHLLDMGHTEIGFNSHFDSNPDHPRIRGMKRALKEAGVAYHPEWRHDSIVYEEGGAQLASWFLGLKDRPTAMCINNDVVASVFVQLLYRSGLKVPEDVSVVGHDDSPVAAHCIVPLTVASQPIWPEAEMVVEFLMERLSGYEGPPRIIINHGELLQRQSVARVVPRS